MSDPIVALQYSLHLLLAKKLKPFPVPPHHFMALYYHLTMVTCLSSPFNQTSGAEEKVLLDFYMSAWLSRIAQHAVKENSENYRSLLLPLQKV